MSGATKPMGIDESADDHSQELALTLLIEALFDWLARAYPRLLFYGDVDFRHALECYFYFTGINQPAGLMPLLRATSQWRNGAIGRVDLAGLVATYDDFMQKGQDQRVKTAYLRSVKAFYIKLATLKQSLKRSTINVGDTGREDVIVFFAANNRYVSFFQRVIEKIGQPKCRFVALGQPEVIKAAQHISVNVLDDRCERVELRNISIPCWHSLYPEYMTMLQQFLLAVGTLRSVNAKAVVFAEGTSVQDALVASAAKALGMPTIRLQSGRAGILHSAYRKMPFDTMLVWGEGMAARFRQYSPDAQYVLTGNPDIQPPSVGEVATRRRFFAEKYKVLTVFTQPINPNLESREYDLLVGLVMNVLKQQSDLAVLVRKHPVDRYTGFEAVASELNGRLKITSVDDASLQEVITASDLVLGFYSTTLSESAAYGLPAVILQLRKEHEVFPFPERHAAAIGVGSEHEACMAIHKILHDVEYMQSMKANMKSFSEYYFGPRDGQAIDRVGGSIMRLANKS